MKKIVSGLIVIFAMAILVSACQSYDDISMVLGADVSAAEVISEGDNHGGFHGDGAGRWSPGRLAAADVACAGLARGGGRGGAGGQGPGTWQARPDSRTCPGPWICHLQEATQIPPAPGRSHWPLQPEFLLPSCTSARGLAEGARVC